MRDTPGLVTRVWARQAWYQAVPCFGRCLWSDEVRLAVAAVVGVVMCSHCQAGGLILLLDTSG